MIIYEITSTVRVDLIEKYEKYMREIHIPEILATRFFSGARISRTDENRYRIQYEAHDQSALDDYLNTKAAHLRADFLAHFGEAVVVSRENWEVLQIWSDD